MPKLLLLFVHLLGTSLALGAIVATDLRLLAKLADDRVRIAPPNPYVMRLITLALAVLVATGAGLVLLGLAERPDYLHNPKLLAKLTLVGALSLNAWVLHRHTFPGLARGRAVSRWRAADHLAVALPVAVSNGLWMYCAFLGIARPWSWTVSYGFVMQVAGCVVLAALVGVLTLLLIAAQDRRGPERGFVGGLKRQLGAVARVLRA